MDHADDLALALGLADLADGITVGRFRAADLRVTSKPDRTPVTDADTTTEDALRSVLATQRPADAVRGEERADQPGSGAGETNPAGRTWIIDPIDGTKNFSRGMPVWATLIALTMAGRAVVGVVSAPAMKRRWWAHDGGGAWTSDPDGAVRRIEVSAVAELDAAYLSTTDLHSFLELGTMPRYLDLAGRCWATRAFGDFWQHCLVAEGAIDLGLDAEASSWDLAALQVLVEQAGGRLTDLEGAARYDGGSGLSSNGRLHGAALAVLSPGTAGVLSPGSAGVAGST